MGDNDKELIRADKNLLSRQHHFLGMHLRNEWGLWKKTGPIVKDFQKRFGLFGHGDDISGLLFYSVTRQIRGESLDIEKEIEKYWFHWLDQGVDPKTGKKIKKTKNYDRES